jgi:hypothetical protein
MTAIQSLSVSSAPGREIVLVFVSPRGAFTLVALSVMLRFMGGLATLRIHDCRTRWLKSGLVLLTTVCFVGALRYQPFAGAIGIAFARPMFSVALGRLCSASGLVGSWRRLVPMVNPTGHGFGNYADVGDVDAKRRG